MFQHFLGVGIKHVLRQSRRLTHSSTTHEKKLVVELRQLNISVVRESKAHAEPPLGTPVIIDQFKRLGNEDVEVSVSAAHCSALHRAPRHSM